MKSVRKRVPALMLALTMTAGTMVPAASAVTIPAVCDETYYATLDPYGGIKEASVVKSYRLNGATSVTDYGVYDQVINLTDALTPTVGEDTVTFELGEEAPEKFYFEGKTKKPFEELPWNIAVSYKLNGAPTPAEELAGKTGLVEIGLDVTVDPQAPDYSRENLVLTVAAVFNDDDVTSLEAPGAQIQMVGNLRAVLFLVLPGEEQEFVIRVGSEDFSFSGLVFLAMPATFRQLEQVRELREAKEKGEDSLDAIGDSMDAILNAMEGMRGSLNAAAGGLDQLNDARRIVSDGKEEVYGRADLALGDLDALADALGGLDGYADTVSEAITDLNGALDGLNDTLQELKPELADTRKVIAALQKDTKALTGLLEDVESYNKKATSVASCLAEELDDLEVGLSGLDTSLRRLRNALDRAKGISTLSTSDILSLLSPEEAEQMKDVLEYHRQYERAIATPEVSGVPADTSFENFLLLAAFKTEYEKQVEETIRQQIAEAYRQYAAGAGASAVSLQDFMKLPEVQQQIADGKAAAQANFQTAFTAFLTGGSEEAERAKATAKAASDAYDQFEAKQPILNTVNGKIREVNSLITSLTYPTAIVVNELAELCDSMDDTGIAAELAALAELCRDLLKTMKEHEGEGADLLEHMDDLGDLAGRITHTAEGLLERVDELTGVVDAYESSAQSAVADIRTLSGSAQSTLHDLSASLAAMEQLLRSTGPQLDEGTRNTLSGVSASLRKATLGLNEIYTIRDAKDTIKGLVEDEWDSHTGEVDGLLNIDATADPVSMTDPRNPTPGSIQYVMRTQEIKAEEKTEEPAEQEDASPSTFWDRVADLFRGLWADLKRLLHMD